MILPPSGTITFLFTDVEGSTRLRQACQPAMTAALRTHDALLRRTLTENEDYIFKTVGDAFCCAFQTAGRAVAEICVRLDSLLATTSNNLGIPQKSL